MSKVLLVEDDNNLREIYQARLAAEGYDIVAAQNGEEALVMAKQSKPDLVISDVMMPRISGFEMLDILRNTNELKDTKVIMLTALGQAEDQARADNLGADKYLVKSQVTLEDIVNAAKELLSESMPAQPAPAADPTVTVPVPADTPVAASDPEPVAPTPPAETPAEPAPEALAVAADVPTVPALAPALPEPVPGLAVPEPEPVMPTPPVIPAPVVAVEPTATEPPAMTAPPVVDIPPNDTVVPASVVPQAGTTVVVPPAPANPVPPAVTVAPIIPPVAASDPEPVAPTPPAETPAEPAPGPAPELSVPAAAPSAEPTPSAMDPVASLIGSDAPLSMEAEEAAVQAQIDNFAAAPADPAPEVPVAADPTPPPEQANNDQTILAAVDELNKAVDPAPVVPANPNPVAAPAADTPVAATATPAPAPQSLGGTKVIQPLSSSTGETGPSLADLLAREEAKEAADTPLAVPPAGSQTPPAASGGVDPNSIAL